MFDARVIAASSLLLASAAIPVLADGEDATVQSRVIETAAGELVLTQEVVIEATLGDVWAAYTTSEGWEAWAATHAEVDLRAGGTIRTHYGADVRTLDDGAGGIIVVPVRSQNGINGSNTQPPT